MRSEFEFIETVRRRAFSSRAGTGIGDDCAVIPKDSKTDLTITADLLVEDVDFRLGWTTPEFLGHKALAVSLSDAAAMGAAPVWAMLSIGVPEKIWKTDFVEKFYEGWFALAGQYRVELVGGDVSRTPEKIVVDSVVAGEVKKNRAVLRSTAQPGDAVLVSGSLGGAAAGLRLLEGGERHAAKSKNAAIQNLILRQLKPAPRVELGLALGEKDLATAMIDLSDGLAGDLAHLCRESKVGARIYADKIPVDENLKKISAKGRRDAGARKEIRPPFPLLPFSLSAVLSGGEDFELLFTASPKKNFRLEKLLENHAFSRIGEITSDAGKIELITDSGAEILPPAGFRHF